jgi:hypothetical protein
MTYLELLALYNAAYNAYDNAWEAHIAWKEQFFARSFVPFRSWTDLNETLDEVSPFRTEKIRLHNEYNALFERLIAHPGHHAAKSVSGIKEDWQND